MENKPEKQKMAYSADFTPPPQYQDVFEEHSSVGGLLTVQDFLPQLLKEPGVFSHPKFEPFSVLVTRANEFLAKHLHWEAKSCESVEFKCKTGASVNPEQMTYLELGSAGNTFVRGLRLWLVPRITKQPQKIGYINVVPRVISNEGLGWPEFASLDDTLKDFNQRTRENPNELPGRIVTIETQEMKTDTAKNFDPDKTFWYEYAEVSNHFIVVIRVFFEYAVDVKMEREREEIGVADFKPAMLNEGGAFVNAKYEPFSNVIMAASCWCSEQQAIRFCNAQTFEVKVKTGNSVDTQKMSYMERGTYTTFYVRILRVGYVTLTGDRVAPPLNLSCKNFVPYTLKVKTMGCDDYESFSKTRQRIEEWLKATGGRVLSCETAAMRLKSGGERQHGLETSYTYNLAKVPEYWLYVIRIWLDGIYTEPPAEVLSRPPNVQQDSCVVF